MFQLTLFATLMFFLIFLIFWVAKDTFDDMFTFSFVFTLLWLKSFLVQSIQWGALVQCLLSWFFWGQKHADSEEHSRAVWNLFSWIIMILYACNWFVGSQVSVGCCQVTSMFKNLAMVPQKLRHCRSDLVVCRLKKTCRTGWPNFAALRQGKTRRWSLKVPRRVLLYRWREHVLDILSARSFDDEDLLNHSAL